GVEEVDAGVAACLVHRGRRRLVGIAAERHGAEAQFRDLDAGAAEQLVFHGPVLKPNRARLKLERRLPSDRDRSVVEVRLRHDAGLAGSSRWPPSTVSVTEAGGSPSARIQPRLPARRIAASIASRLSVASLPCSLSTFVQVGGGRWPVSSRTAASRLVRH